MQLSFARPILIIQTAFIGDTILASSFAQDVHRAFPDAPLHFLLRKGNEAVIRGLPFVAHTHVWDKKRGKTRSLWRLIRELRKYEFQFVFNLHRHFNSGLVTALMRAGRKVGFRQNPLSWSYDHRIDHRIPHEGDGGAWHEVQRNYQLLQAVRPDLVVPMDLTGHRPVLPLTDDHRRTVAPHKTAPFVVLAPASVWFTKQWEEVSYRELVAQLAPRFRVLLIGGPDDRALCERVKGTSDAVNLAGQLSLLESAALMEGARRVFVNDSGPLHLASAVDAPTTALFCATIPQFGYGPLSTDAIVLETPEPLSCRPCGLHGGTTCPAGHFKCAKNISVSMAVATLETP